MPEYQIWAYIKYRVTNPKHREFHNYGGRGIIICNRWRDSFVSFFEDVGPCPGKGYSIDRINNDGNYEPGNVRWATAKEQANNRRTNHFITYQDQTKTIAEWEKHLDFPRNLIYARLKNGWTIERALTSRPQR